MCNLITGTLFAEAIFGRSTVIGDLPSDTNSHTLLWSRIARVAGHHRMGFKLYVPDEAQGVIIATFLFPDDPNFDFTRFYNELATRGFVIYPGKLTKADCFRVGSIGRLFESDSKALVGAMREVLADMGVALPVTQILAE